MAVDPVISVGLSGGSYYYKTEMRVRSRLDYITETFGIDRVSGQVTSEVISDLNAQLEEYVLQVDDR